MDLSVIIGLLAVGLTIAALAVSAVLGRARGRERFGHSRNSGHHAALFTGFSGGDGGGFGGGCDGGGGGGCGGGSC